MFHRLLSTTSGVEVSTPACLVLVDRNDHPLERSIFFLTNSKNDLKVKYPFKMDQFIKVEFEQGCWWLQEVMFFKDKLENKPNVARIQLQDRSIVSISSATRRSSRMFFCSNLIQCLPFPKTTHHQVSSNNALASAIKTIEEEMTCSICLDCFTDPIILVSCGHSMCNKCFGQWNRLNPTCPLCQQKVNGQLSNHSFRNMIKATNQLKLALKPKPVPPPEVIIIDDEDTKAPALVFPTTPCRYRTRPRVENNVEVIEIE